MVELLVPLGGGIGGGLPLRPLFLCHMSGHGESVSKVTGDLGGEMIDSC